MAPHQKEQGVTLVELVIVVAIALIIAGMAVPKFLSTQRNYRASGDARDIAAEILLAKMRASSDFTQARVRFNVAANNGFPKNTFQIELWDKTNSVWTIDAPSGTTNLSQGITFGFGAQTHPPPNTQIATAIGLGTEDTSGNVLPCTSGASGSLPGSVISGNPACITFNSRGIPVDNTGSPTSYDAVYLTDGFGVYATTLSATGLLQQWRIDVGDTTAAHWAQR